MRRPARLLAAGLAALVVLGGGGILLWQRLASAPAPASSVRIGVSTGAPAALAHLAAELGAFREAGVTAELRAFSAGRLAAEAAARGELDFATTADFVIARRAFDRDDLRVLAVISSYETVFVLARRSRGIAEPRDLAGKTVALAVGSSPEFLLDRFLRAVEVDPAGVEVVDRRAPADLLEALETGSADAVATWDPHVETLRTALGDDAVVFSIQEDQPLYFLLVARADRVEARPERVARVLAGLHAALEEARARSDDLPALLGPRFDLDEATTRRVLDRIRLRLDLPQALFTTLEDQARWLVETGAAAPQQRPNFLRVVAPGPLAEVVPDAVGIVR